eukprot:TRINITY_DN8018_c0_g1_i2.p1 TRINITY_DN8018_c0_g1~~TRINITY_DN8018_c0_g1_i2.p1  ORF type:complete len:448 (+),score=105.55 TRINITY_DN8018_c0_g1_i2:1022-2365(+)
MHEVEQALWNLGIPLTTRHQEVAPNQFEFAPIYQSASVAADSNLLMMEVIRRIAERRGLTVLFHEKPFSRINGSGKHNNYSIGTKKTPILFEPGQDPMNNHLFLLSVAGFLRGVQKYQDALRWSIASYSNDNRLGGHEAPPAIISIYLGDHLAAIVDHVISGKPLEQDFEQDLDLRVGHLPRKARDNTDRNRTSPVAFTGNKFEVRGVGSSQNPAHSSYVMNTLMADSFDHYSQEITKHLSNGKSLDQALKYLIREEFEKHRSIVFQGDGYSSSWSEEAKKRGLLNLSNTIQTLDHVNSNDSTRSLFSRFGVLDSDEFQAHINVDYSNYSTTALLEAQCLRDMSRKDIIPAALSYKSRVHKSGILKPLEKNLSSLVGEAYELSEKLDDGVKKVRTFKDEVEAARFGSNQLVPLMKQLRGVLDGLEDVVDRTCWPYPSCEDMLLSRIN